MKCLNNPLQENAPAGAATPEQGASEKCHLQYSTGGENVKLSNHHYQPGAGKYQTNQGGADRTDTDWSDYYRRKKQSGKNLRSRCHYVAIGRRSVSSQSSTP